MTPSSSTQSPTHAAAALAARSPNECHVLLRSAAFDVEQPAGADGRFLGADLAGWLYSRLLRQPGLGHVREAWIDGSGGWAMRVRCGGRRVTLTLHCFAPREHTWYVHLAASRPWRWWRRSQRAAAAAQAREALANVLADPRIEAVRWLEQDPWAGEGEPALFAPAASRSAPR